MPTFVPPALAVVLGRLYPRWGIAFYGAGSLAAAARLVNGAHYVSDVAAGALFGGLVAGLMLRWGHGHETRLMALLPARWRPRDAG